MNRKLLSVVALIVTAMIALVPARAETPPKIINVREKDPVVIKADTAYLLFRARRIMGFRFLYVPAEPGMTPAKAAADRGNWVEVNGWVHVEKDGPIGTFLVPVRPGAYYLYGEKTDYFVGGVEHALMCLCMGTLRFEARAGVITDLGEIRQLHIETDKGKHQDTQGRTITFFGNREIRATAVELPRASDYVPPRLAGFPLEAVTYYAAGFLPNVSGVAIDRISTIPGIIAYDRDKVIDVRTGLEVP